MKKLFVALLLLNSFSLFAQIQTPEWYFLRPGKTGVSGDYHQVLVDDCNGNIWTAGYMPFWADGSVVRFNDEDTVFTCWGNYDGYLPADRVYDIAFDTSAGLWVATNGVGTGGHGGIAYYNGTTWTKFTSLNTPMPADHMRGITVDGNNTVWATFYNTTTSVGGVAKFNGSSWTIYTTANSGLQTSQVDKIKADAQNNIWIGTAIGLIKFDGSNWNMLLSGSDITDVEYDESVNKIYAAAGTAIHVYNGTSWSQINSSNSPVSASNLWTVDARGDTLIIGALASVSGCWIYNGSSWSTHVLPNHVYDVRIDGKGNYWACGIGYVMKYDGNWTTYTRYNTGLVDYFNNKVFIDSKNRKWFANGDGGIQVFNCPKWEIYGPNNGGLFPSPQNLTTIGSSITEDSYGDLWITYDGTLGYAVQIPGGNYKNYNSWVVWNNSNVAPLFQSVKETEADDSGRVFMRLYSNSVFMYRHSNNSWTNYNSSNSTLPSSGNLLCMTPRPGGKMYIGGFMAIYVYDNGAWSTIDLAALSLPILYVYDIGFDKNNYMWLATDHGVYRYNGTTWTNWTTANSNIAADHVTSIEFGKADTVFIGAHNTQTFPYFGGISVYNGTSWNSLMYGSSPIAHRQVEDLDVDTFGNLWIITESEGISVYKKGGVKGFNCINESLEQCGPTSVYEQHEIQNDPISVYPNPSWSTATISYQFGKATIVSFSIFDVNGKGVLEIPGRNCLPGLNKITVDLQQFPGGVYFCQIKSLENFRTLKLIKE
jgi:ligand-binding sensor domain-containing protein